MPKKLTQKFIDGLPYADGKRSVLRDAAVTGLVLKVGQRSKTFVVQRELWVGEPGQRRLIKTVSFTLGRADGPARLTLEQAHIHAKRVLADIESGIDPNAPVAPAPSTVWTLVKAYEEHANDLLMARPGAERSLSEMKARRDRYLGDWLHLPLNDISPEMCRERRNKIVHDVKARARSPRFTGARAANQTLSDLGAVWNIARKVFRELPDSPTKAVGRKAYELEYHHQIKSKELLDWYTKLAKLPSPLRRVMHELGLFSGLRPGNLVAIEKDWIHLDQGVISFPAAVMKGRTAFDLPLSSHMRELVTRALRVAEVLWPGAPFLFPTRSQDGTVIPTRVWREDLLPHQTGHALRHTYSNIASAAGVDGATRMMLLAQKIRGVEGIYVDQPEQFARLLDVQEKVSASLLAMLGMRTG